MSKVAAIQMCSSNHVDENLKTTTQLIQQAAEQGAKLAVLPEMFAIMGKVPTDSVKQQEPYGQGKIQDHLATLAQKHDIWIVGGTMPISCSNPAKARAACIVYNNRGEQVARYDKIHLFDAVLTKSESYNESNTIQPGEEPVVIDTPVGKLGLIVCYDIRFPALINSLMNQHIEILCVPAAFTQKTGKDHWHLLTRCRAIDCFCYVIGANQAGIHADKRKTYGHSIIVDPWGGIIQELPKEGNGIIYADIDLKKLHAIRNTLPTKQHQRPEVY